MPQAFVDRVLKFHSNLLFTTTFMDDRAHQNDQLDPFGRGARFAAVSPNDRAQACRKPCVLLHTLPVHASATSEFLTSNEVRAKLS